MLRNYSGSVDKLVRCMESNPGRAKGVLGWLRELLCHGGGRGGGGVGLRDIADASHTHRGGQRRAAMPLAAYLGKDTYLLQKPHK